MNGKKCALTTACLTTAFAIMPGSGGCTLPGRWAGPGRLVETREPLFQRPYLVYLPSHYGQQERWPLVMTCPGDGPFESPRRQIDEWKRLAEKEGFLLAAPDLKRRKGLGAEKLSAGQIIAEDEGFLLSALRSIRGAHTIDETRVFLAGSGTGALPALYAGLRHPDIWRAICVRQPSFDAAQLDPCVPFLDPYQPIQVLYARGDLIGKKKAEACVTWLQDHDLNLTIIEEPGAHRRDPGAVFRFVSEVVRQQPWIRIHLRDDARNDMAISLAAKMSFEPKRVRWDFGDGNSSTEWSPSHEFSQPGRYTVNLSVWSSGGKRHARQVEVRIPRIRLGATQPATR